ncbi:hypothetical protein SDC9_139055 [bioreactor metagenome]|uniref:Uncharacterized protein n=1 Tax=bioreactor metagenome TaxID=1076179 RepID=A0A645DRJ5_9ZZZZ
MNADGQVAGAVQLRGRFEDQEGDPRSHVAPAGVRSAELVVMRVVEQQAEEIEFRVRVVDPPGGLVPFIIWPEQFVELAARAVAVVGAAGHVEECEPLAGFAQRFRRLRDQSGADGRKFGEILPPLRIVFRHGHVACRVRQAANPAADALDRVDFGLEKFFCDRIAPEFLQRGARFIKQPAPAEREPDLIIRREMSVFSDSAGDIVFLLERKQFRIVEREVRLIQSITEPHSGEHEHPAARQRIVGIDVSRMILHQPAKILSPCIRSCEGAVRVHYRQFATESFRRRDKAVVVLVPRAERGEFLPGLPAFAFDKARDPMVVSHELTPPPFSSLP